MSSKRQVFFNILPAIYVLALACVCAAQSAVDVQPPPPKSRNIAMLNPDKLSSVDVLPANFQPVYTTEKLADANAITPSPAEHSSDRVRLTPSPNIGLEDLEKNTHDLGKRSPDVVRAYIAQANQFANLSSLNIAADMDSLHMLKENPVLESTAKKTRTDRKRTLAKIKSTDASLSMDFRNRDKAYEVCSKVLAHARKKEILAPDDPLTCSKFGPPTPGAAANQEVASTKTAE